MATGQYIKQPHGSSDLELTTVLSSETLATASYTDSTTPIDCRGYRQVDFFIKVETVASMSAIHVQPEAGQTIGGVILYAKYLWELVSAGAATTNIYTVNLTDPAIQDATPYKVSLPVEGRYVRLALKATGGTGVVSVYAARRV